MSAPPSDGPRRGPVAGLVLAAGSGSRMEGGFKLLLPWQGEAVVRAPAATAAAAGLDPVLVVVGHRADDVRRALEGTDARPVENPAWEEGQATSLAAGIRAVRTATAAEAAVVLLGDEPGVLPEDVAAVVDAWRRSGAPAVRAVYRDRPGHPVLVDRSRFEALEALEGDRGARGWLCGPSDQVTAVRRDRPAPVDVDTRPAYRAARREAGA